jgi:ABC-2 type transport system ATP-binding protein
LDFFTSIHPNGNLARAIQISKRLDLDLSRRVAFMSTGMRQKLAIACVMGCPSPLMILDEPTANLDPSVRSVVLELVRETRNEGSTFAFCSHILSEIEELCDDVAILRQGSVVHTGRVASIRQIHRMKAISPRRIDPQELPTGAKCLMMTDRELLVDLPGTMDQYLEWIRTHGLTGIQMEMVGLRSLYESHHQPVAIPGDAKSG